MDEKGTSRTKYVLDNLPACRKIIRNMVMDFEIRSVMRPNRIQKTQTGKVK